MVREQDPYVYPGTSVLKNRLNIRDAELLEAVEIDLVYSRMRQGLPKGQLDFDHLKSIHHHLFSRLYSWAGKIRTVAISKGETLFCLPQYIENEAHRIFTRLHQSDHLLKALNFQNFTKKAAFYFNEVDALHPFREGNGRSMRIFFSELAEQGGYRLNWEKVSRKEYIAASIVGITTDDAKMIRVFSQIAAPLHRIKLVEMA